MIIVSPYVGRDFIKRSTYRQMVGRAGRAGLTESGDSVLLCQEKDKEKVINTIVFSIKYNPYLYK